MADRTNGNWCMLLDPSRVPTIEEISKAPELELGSGITPLEDQLSALRKYEVMAGERLVEDGRAFALAQVFPFDLGAPQFLNAGDYVDTLLPEEHDQPAYHQIAEVKTGQTRLVRYRNPLTDREHLLAVYNHGDQLNLVELEEANGVPVGMTSRRTRIDRDAEIAEELANFTF